MLKINYLYFQWILISFTLSIAFLSKKPLKQQYFSLRQASINNENVGLMIRYNDYNSILKYPLNSIDCPKVIPPDDDQDVWKLWYHGRDTSIQPNVINSGTGRIYFATSKDGISNWQHHEASPVMNPSKEAGDWFWYDSEHIGVGDVIVPGVQAQSKFISANGVLIMYIFGGNGDKLNLNSDQGEKIVIGSKMEIGVAVSQDGIYWSKIEGSSAYASILSVSKNPIDFDSSFIASPSVVENGLECRMYYHTYDIKSMKFVVGLASAYDGFLNWKKYGCVFRGGDKINDFDYDGVTRRHVIRLNDGTHQMWYEGISSSKRHSIGVATSVDGVNWQKVSDEPVFQGNQNNPNAWDSGNVGSPHLVWLPEKKRWRMYYVGTKYLNDVSSSTFYSVNGEGIGIAESLDEQGLLWSRIGVITNT